MTDPGVPVMKWWGWGDPAQRPHVPAQALDRLRSVIGGERRQVEPVPLDDVQLSKPDLQGKVRDGLAAIVGEEWLRDDRESRVLHAAGKGYPDLVRIRSGSIEQAPDAVVYPEDEAQLRAVIELCAEHGIAVVPFGGGTSVVGGVEPVREGFRALVSLDLARMRTVGQLDRRSLTVTLGPGLRGPAAERALASQGVTLGHFPQSFEYSSVGGWVATRSAGQASTGYGKIEEMVAGLRCVTPAGTIALPPLPASAAGPQLREFLVGSEGVLGVISSATLRVRPRPAVRRYEGWMFKSFPEGAEAFRRLEQQGAAPELARLSDEIETALSLQMAEGGSASRRLGLTYMRARGYGGGCLAILGFEGDNATVTRRRATAARVLRSEGGLALGTGPGRAWERQRFATPYLRDALLDNCVMVETLETAAEWSRLMELYAAVAQAIRSSLEARGTPPLVMCHVSHLYPDGASLYFTFMAAQEEDTPLDQWQAAKSAACDAITSNGGTITHHHAIGRDHAAWLEREVGELGVELIRSAKKRLDPGGIMNPGKLLPPGDGKQEQGKKR